MDILRRFVGAMDIAVVRDGAITVAPLPTKCGWTVYRSNITATDVSGESSIVNVTNAEACSTAYHPAQVLPIECTQSVLYVRVLTDTNTDVVIHPVLFSSSGGGGCYPYGQRSITLKKTGMQIGTHYVTEFVQIDVGPDDQAHVFVSNLGGATSVSIETRNG
jgi:hypothetical protein